MNGNSKIEEVRAENRQCADTLGMLKTTIDKAVTLVQDILEDYFEKYRSPKECKTVQERQENSEAILWEYPKYATYAGILADVLVDARKTIESTQEEKGAPEAVLT